MQASGIRLFERVMVCTVFTFTHFESDCLYVEGTAGLRDLSYDRISILQGVFFYLNTKFQISVELA